MSPESSLCALFDLRWKTQVGSDWPIRVAVAGNSIRVRALVLVPVLVRAAAKSGLPSPIWGLKSHHSSSPIGRPSASGPCCAGSLARSLAYRQRRGRAQKEKQRASLAFSGRHNSATGSRLHKLSKRPLSLTRLPDYCLRVSACSSPSSRSLLAAVFACWRRFHFAEWSR